MSNYISNEFSMSNGFYTKLLLFGVSIILLAFLIYYGNPQKLIDIISVVDPTIIILLLFFGAFSLLIRVFRFQFLLKRKYKINFIALLPIHIYGLALGNIVPGRLSEPIRAILLKVIKGIPFTFSLACVFFERLSDILVLLIFSLFAFHFVNASIFTTPIFTIPFIIILLIIILVIITSQSKLTLKLIGLVLEKLNLKKYTKIIVLLFKDIKFSKEFIVPFVLSFVIWSIDGFIFFGALQAVGADIQFFHVLSFFSLSLIIGLISFLPGGIGSMEASMTLLLTYTGIDYPQALSGVLLARLLTLWLGIIAGMLLSLTIEKEKIKKVKR